MFEEVKQKHKKVIIIGGGESLVGFDFDQLNDFEGAIITVNNVIFHIPRADYWMTVDPMDKNGEPQRGMLEQFEETYYYCAFPDLEKQPQHRDYYQMVEDIHYLERIVPSGNESNYGMGKIDGYALQEDKDKITTGDSIYGALGLAYHFGAKKIVMLGVDGYGYGHWYDKKEPYNSYKTKDFKKNYLDNIPRIYEQSVKQFEDRGCEVVNGSPKGTVTCFQKMTPQKAVEWIK